MLVEKLNALMEFVSRNKLLSFLFALFTASCAIVVEHVYEGDQDYANIRALVTAMNAQTQEFEAAQQVDSLYYDSRVRYARFTNDLEKLVEGDALSPAKVKQSTQRLLELQVEARKDMAVYRARILAPHFTVSDLKYLRDGVSMDLEHLDAFLAKRIEFSQAMLTDMKKANEMAVELRHNFDGWQYGNEADARESVTTSLLEKARLDYNDRVADANAKLSQHRWRERRFLAAVTYASMCIGGCLGWLVARFRRHRKEAASFSLYPDETEVRDRDQNEKTKP